MRLKAAALLLLVSGFAEAWALDLRPEVLVLRAAQGEKTSADVIVVNDSSETVHVRLEAKDRWFRLSPRGLRLAPGESRAVRFKARVPKAMGELSGEIWARAGSAKAETRVVRRAILWVAGTELFEGRISPPVASPLEGGMAIQSKLQNWGNVSLRPKVVAEVEAKDGAILTQNLDFTDSPLPPMASVPVEAKFDLTVQNWSGWARVSAYYRNAEGNTLQVHQVIGTRHDKP